ncbi:MAG: hypothetical protein AB7O47_07990 [Flavobacteriales bacterium]
MKKGLSQEEMKEIFDFGLANMPKDSNPVKYIQLIYSEESDIIVEAFRNILDSGIYISHELFKRNKGNHRPEIKQNATIIFQMIMTKGISLLDLYDGMDYENQLDSQIKLNGINDPFSMSLIVRNQLESYSNFNNIFLSSERKEVVELLHNFWILCGLKRRQKFIHSKMEKDQLEKGQKEKIKIDNVLSLIENSSIFKNLSADNKKHIKKGLNKNNFQFQFDGSEFKLCSWEHLFNSASNTEHLKHLYAEMSLKSHPSYVSVFQFAQSTTIKDTHFQASFYLHMSRIIMAFLISDCVKYFPEAKEIYAELPELNRALISSLNRNMRDKKWLVLDDDVAYGQKTQLEVFEFIDNEINNLNNK